MEQPSEEPIGELEDFPPDPPRIWPWIILAILPFIIVAGITAPWWLPQVEDLFQHSAQHKAASALPPLPTMVDQRLKPLTPEQALVANAAIMPSKSPVEVANPFLIPAAGSIAAMRLSALDCLTAAVYYEAAGEPDIGQRAVAQVVLNRVRHPAFPNSVCGVVFQGSERQTGCQFSFTCDGSLARRPSQSGWDRARRVANLALSGLVEPSVGTATHYHTIWVLPYWASSLDKVTTINAHIFYRWKGYWGRRASFTGRYQGESMTSDELENMLNPMLDTMDPAALPSDSAVPIAPPAFDPGGPRGTIMRDESAGTLIAPTARPSLQADENRGQLRVDDLPKVVAP